MGAFKAAKAAKAAGKTAGICIVAVGILAWLLWRAARRRGLTDDDVIPFGETVSTIPRWLEDLAA
jgi:hypothetical protein